MMPFGVEERRSGQAAESVVLPGAEFPLGATPTPENTNFAVVSAADGVLPCLFDSLGAEIQIPLPERDGGVWHGFVPGIGPVQAYGYRVTDPYDPRRGFRCNPAKLLLDPYARGWDGLRPVSCRRGRAAPNRGSAYPGRPGRCLRSPW